MGKKVKGNLTDGRRFLICKGPVQSPHLHILSGDSKSLEFVYDRSGQNQRFGPDRRWNNTLLDGSTVYEAGVPPLMKVVRVVEDEKMQLQDGSGNILCDVDRVVKGMGYRYPDIRHRFTWDGRTYIMEGQKTFTGKNMTTVDEKAGGEMVLNFNTTFFKRSQIGEVIISSKVPPEDLRVVLCAWLAFWEWDGRRTLLTFGDPYLNQDVVA